LPGSFVMARYLQRGRAIAGYALILAAVGVANSASVSFGLGGGGDSAVSGPVSYTPAVRSDALAPLNSANSAAIRPRLEFAMTTDSRSNAAKRGARGERARTTSGRSGLQGNAAYDLQGMPPWMNKTTPAVGSPEWRREQQETERQEQYLKSVIEGICHGC